MAATTQAASAAPTLSTPSPAARWVVSTPAPSESAAGAGGIETATPAPVASPPTPAPTRPPADLLRYISKDGAPLPADFVPPDLVPLPAGLSSPPGLMLRAEAAGAFVAMAEAARQDGLTIVAVSTYRSFAEQGQVYADEVRLFGKAQADRESAVPGRSEHQLGTTVDISAPSVGYALDDTIDKHPEGQWLLAHAVSFGFVLSYPEGKEQITGYRYEPWHYRYVGVDNARYIALSGLTSTEILRAHQSIDDDLPLPPPLPRKQGGCRNPGPPEEGC